MKRKKTRDKVFGISFLNLVINPSLPQQWPKPERGVEWYKRSGKTITILVRDHTVTLGKTLLQHLSGILDDQE